MAPRRDDYREQRNRHEVDPQRHDSKESNSAHGAHLLHTQGATPGHETPGVQPNYHRPEEAEKEVDPKQVAAFSRELAEAALAQDAAQDEEAQAQLVAEPVQEEQSKGMDREDEVALEPQAEFNPGEDRYNRPQEPRKKGRKRLDGTPEAGDGDEGGGEETPDDEGVEATDDDAGNTLPEERAKAIGLVDLLKFGEEAGFLLGYAQERVEPTVVGLRRKHFALLKTALDAVESSTGKVLVLKALVASRPPSQLGPFAQLLEELGEEAVWGRMAEPEGGVQGSPAIPADLPTIRRCYDPIVLFDPESIFHQSWAEKAQGAPWTIPTWMERVPVAPLDLSIVAFDLALSGELSAAEEVRSGGSDALAAAVMAHGHAHPSLARWLLTLSARVQDRNDLLLARAALLEARSQALHPAYSI